MNLVLLILSLHLVCVSAMDQYQQNNNQKSKQNEEKKIKIDPEKQQHNQIQTQYSKQQQNQKNLSIQEIENKIKKNEMEIDEADGSMLVTVWNSGIDVNLKELYAGKKKTKEFVEEEKKKLNEQLNITGANIKEIIRIENDIVQRDAEIKQIEFEMFQTVLNSKLKQEKKQSYVSNNEKKQNLQEEMEELMKLLAVKQMEAFKENRKLQETIVEKENKLLKQMKIKEEGLEHRMKNSQQFKIMEDVKKQNEEKEVEVPIKCGPKFIGKRTAPLSKTLKEVMNEYCGQDANFPTVWIQAKGQGNFGLSAEKMSTAEEYPLSKIVGIQAATMIAFDDRKPSETMSEISTLNRRVRRN